MKQMPFGLAVACAACLACAAAADVLEAEYSAAYATLTVRVTPGAVAVFDAAHLRAPNGEPGLLGEYFDMSRARDGILKMEQLGDTGAGAEPVVSRIETRMDFPWGDGAPAGGIPGDWFAARWTGKIGPLPFAARLVTVTDDGVRLWLDGKKVIDDWTGHPPKENIADTPLATGRVAAIRLEYFEAVAGAMCRLGYRLPDDVAAAVRSAEVTLTAPDGGEALKRRMTWEGERGELRLEVADLPGGIYTVEALLPGVPGAFTHAVAIQGRAAETAKIDVAEGSYAGTFTVSGGARFTVEPPRVRVETKRYIVEFIDMGISQITDRKTGQQYCAPGGMRPGRNAALALKTYMPGRPDPTFFHLPHEPDAQRTRVTRLKHGVAYTVTGLVSPGDAETRRYNPEAMLGLRIAFDADTGDLCLTALGHAGVPERFGVYDTGIFSVGFNVGPFKQEEIQFINPAGPAAAVSSFKGWDAWWPVGYPVALMVFEAPGGGCAAVWADDPQLDYGKKFRIHDGTVRFEAVAGDAPWRVGALEAPIWRLNLFDSWEPAALRYRGVMERTLDLKKIARREPARARSIRTVLHAEAYDPDRIQRLFVDQGVPVEAFMSWETQRWAEGYGVELLCAKRDLWYPNYPFEHPTHYRGHRGFQTFVKQNQDFGVPIFPYTLMFYGMSQPFEKDSRVLRAPDADFTGGGRMWWVLYANMMDEIVQRYGVQGIYNDCSWVGPRYDPRGKVDDLTVWQAHVQGRHYMRDRLLPVAFMGERQHEVTMVSDFIALLYVWGEVHPINHYLFGPYTWRFNTGGGNDLHATLDANESMGAIPWVTGDPFASAERQERAVFNKYLLFWGQEMLTPYFPEKYEPGVLVYLRGKDGTEYRTKRGGGMGLMRVKNGTEEVVWWRTAKVAEFRSPAAAIDGWVAYDGERIIGLYPERRYAILEEHPRPEVTISRLPEGAWLSLSRSEEGYWVAAVAGRELRPAVELEIASGGKKISFIGAEVLDGPSADGIHRIRVTPGAPFAACWNRAPRVVAELPASLGAPAGRIAFVGGAGLPVISQKAELAADAANQTLWWRSSLQDHALQADYLLTLPETPAALTAVTVDDGKVKEAALRVLVNGKVVAEVTHEPGKPTPLRSSLAAFAGQTVLLTLDGKADGAFGVRALQLEAIR